MEVYDIGDTVLCDLCNKDFTESDRKGGFIFNGKAVCPDCESATMKNIRKYSEEKYIECSCPEGQTFKQFVLDYRDGDNTVKIISF